MIPAQLEYVRATSLDEALQALAQPDAKALAGGQSLVSILKLRIVRPSTVVDIGGLDLTGIAIDGGELRIGALATWAELADAPDLQQPGLAAIAECAGSVGDLQVRNRGTIGGSLAHVDPASDMPAVMLALSARVRVRSATAEREIDVGEFFVGPFTTTLAEDELLTEVIVPVPPAGSGSAYRAIEHPASGFALAGAAALVRPDGTRAIGVTGIAPAPFRLAADADPVAALDEIDAFGDRFAPAEYRAQLARVVVGRALEAAESRARGEDRG